MTTVHDAMEAYMKACRKNSVATHPFVMAMLDYIVMRGKSTGRVDINDLHLQLAGDNYLVTTQRIMDADVLPLCAILNTTSIIKSLDLRYNRISDHGAVVIAQTLEKNTSLRHLSLLCNDIGPDGGAAIAKSLMKNTTLKSLQLAGNKIGKKGGMTLAEALQINSTIEVLDLGDCDLEIDCLIALATVLRANTSVKTLNVSRPLLSSIQEEALVHYGQMLRVNVSLQELHLEKCDIRDFGTGRISEALTQNTKLQVLNLRNNRITRDGTLSLAKALTTNLTLKVLDLGANRIEDPGAIYLAKCLRDNNNMVKILVVTFNNIKSEGLHALAEMMYTNFGLDEIYIWGNVFDDKSCRAFRKLIETGRLKPDRIDIRPYEVDGVVYAAELNNRPSRHRFWMPYYGDDVPEENKFIADYVMINGSAQDAAQKPSKAALGQIQ